jgi:hypothetical protein
LREIITFKVITTTVINCADAVRPAMKLPAKGKVANPEKLIDMALPNIFTREVSDKVIQRINQLSTTTQPRWGKMNVAQMLAHCNVTYEFVYENKHPQPNPLMKLILRLVVKKTVTSETPYKHNSRTAPAFLITDTKDFETEKNRLINYINRTQQLGEKYFDNKASFSFGKLNITEWNNMFYKHLDHHLTQFGV